MMYPMRGNVVLPLGVYCRHAIARARAYGSAARDGLLARQYRAHASDQASRGADRRGLRADEDPPDRYLRIPQRGGLVAGPGHRRAAAPRAVARAPARGAEKKIGRASCRERGEITVGNAP